MCFSHVKASDHADANRPEHDTGTDTDEALWDLIIEDGESCQ